MLATIASLIDGGLADARDHYAMLLKARPKPFVLDDATIADTKRVNGEGLEWCDVYDRQLQRWRSERLTGAQQREVARLQSVSGELRVELTRSLSSPTNSGKGRSSASSRRAISSLVSSACCARIRRSDVRGLRMASIERTAYPRFRRLVTARELASLSPSGDDVAWAREHTRSGEHLFSLVLSLVCFGQLGYFPRPGEVPAAVVEYVRRELGLPHGTAAWCEARNVKAQRQLVRGRLGVVHDPQPARAVAEAGIRSAAEVMNHPPDLINVALELLVKASLELPAFSTVDELASRVRREVNTDMFERVAGRIALPDRVGLENLLDVVGPGPTTPYNRLKQPAGKASWSGFREQVDHLRWVDSLGDTRAWLEGIEESKIADFAGEAMAADAAVMRDVAPLKRTALLACMVHVARTRARDDLAEMFCKRMASVTKLAKAELAEIREHEAEISERLIISYRSVLGCLDPRSSETADAAAALRRARRIVEDAGGFDAQLAEIEAVSAHHANNYMPLVAKHRRRSRGAAQVRDRGSPFEVGEIAGAQPGRAAGHDRLDDDHVSARGLDRRRAPLVPLVSPHL